MKIRLLLALMLIGSASMAQRSDKYWVIESNKFDKEKTIVRIYDRANVLLLEQTLNREVNIYSKRDKRYLNRMVADFNKSSDTTTANRNATKQPANKRLRRG